jgi:hypothetical protein
VHVTLAGQHLKTVPSRLSAVDVARLRANDARPAGPPPAREWDVIESPKSCVRRVRQWRKVASRACEEMFELERWRRAVRDLHEDEEEPVLKRPTGATPRRPPARPPDDGSTTAVTAAPTPPSTASP